MISEDTVRQLALSFPGAEELPHFENTSFRVKKKIFATMNTRNQRVCLKLPPEEQDVFSLYDKTIIYPVPNKWGKQGWTLVEMNKVHEETLLDAMKVSYDLVTAKKPKPIKN